MRSTDWKRAAALALTIIAVACDAGTDPQPGLDVDTEAALADYDAVARALGADELDGFRALAGRTPFGSGPAAVDAMGAFLSDRGPGSAGASATALARALLERGATGAASRAPIISPFTRGATYTYDPEADRYRLAAGREGAPETGVRFVLYDTDAAGRPIAGQEAGYADLIDEGDDSAEDIVLHLIVVQDATTLLDYRTSLDETETGGALTVDGFLQGDQVRLDFSIGARSTHTDGPDLLDVDFELRVDARDFSIVGNLDDIVDGVDGEGTIDILVRHRDDSIHLDVTGTDGILDGTVLVNGDVFATVSGPQSDPTFLGRDGSALTFSEFLVLRHIVDAIEDVFDLLEDLLDPVDELVILGIVL